MKVSAAIIAYNASGFIPRFLKSLFNQTRSPDEIVIVDDASTDNTFEIIRKITAGKENVVLKKLPKRLSRGAARNESVKLASGDIVYFVDVDVVMHPKCLENILKGFRGEKIAGVAGNVHGLYRDTIAAKVSHEIYRDSPHYATWNIAYRKSVLIEVGMFNDLHYGSDMDLAYRIMKKGYKIAYRKDALIFHEHPRTITHFLRQKYNYGKYVTPLLKVEPGVLKIMRGASAFTRLSNPLYLLTYALGATFFFIGRLMGEMAYRRGKLKLGSM